MPGGDTGYSGTRKQRMELPGKGKDENQRGELWII